MPVLRSTNQNGEGSIRALCMDADPQREAMDPAMAADSTGAEALTAGAALTGNTAETRTEEGEAGPAEFATTRKSGSRRSQPIAFKCFFSSLSEYFCSTQMHHLNSKTSRYVIFFLLNILCHPDLFRISYISYKVVRIL